MRILFLDVDGVLNTYRDAEVASDAETVIFYRLNRRLIERVLKIVEDTDCKIVLSSSWRNFSGGRETIEYWKIPILDVTPYHSENYTCRGAEIQEWIDAHPEIEEYCIVDDDGDMLDSQLRNFVQTDPEYGLTSTLAYRITHMLNHGARNHA